MFRDFLLTISETRRTIRHQIHQKHVYNNCHQSLRIERSNFKKAEDRLKRHGFGVDLDSTLSLRQVFETILKDPEHQKKKTPRNQLFTKLNQMAGERIIDYLNNRVSFRSQAELDLKLIEKKEKKAINSLDKLLKDYKTVNSFQVVHFALTIENLKADLSELASANKLGLRAAKELKELKKHLTFIHDWGLWRETDELSETLLPEKDISDTIFDHVVEIHMLLCSFKNELLVFPESRDLILHLEAISDFKNTFFNYLIVDWIEEVKIKLCSAYVRKTLNSLNALLKGLDARIIKTENELSVTTQEQKAILEQLQKQSEKKSS